MTRILARALSAALATLIGSTAVLAASVPAAATDPCSGDIQAASNGEYCYLSYDAIHASITRYIGVQDIITIPDELDGYPVSEIGTAAFLGMELTSVTIPESVTMIRDSAFALNSLSTVRIPDLVTVIGMDAFANNTTLISVTLGSSVEYIYDRAFQFDSIATLVIPDSVREIRGYAFEHNELTSVTLGSNVRRIGALAFAGNHLTSMTFPDSVDWIETGAFKGTRGWDGEPDGEGNRLTSITFGSGSQLLQVGDGAFADNYLPTVELPDTLVTIGTGAFSHNSLTTVELPDALSDIGDTAFYSNSLTLLTIPNLVNEIGSQAFDGNPLTAVTMEGDEPATMGAVVFGGPPIEEAEFSLATRIPAFGLGGPAPLNAELTQGRALLPTFGFTGSPPTCNYAPTVSFHSTANFTPGSAGCWQAGPTQYQVGDWVKVTFSSPQGTPPARSDLTALDSLEGYVYPLQDDPGPVTATGWRFDGWFDAASAGSTVEFPITVLDHTTIYAYWTQLFDVTYPSAHGTAPGPAVVPDGDTVADPGPLTATGWRFDGWFDAASGGAEIEFPLTVTANTDIYAHWTQLFDVSYASAHDTAPAAAVVPDGDTVADPGALAATGWRFDGWFDAASGGNALTFPLIVTADTDIYAHWTRMYDVAYTSAHASAPSATTVATGTDLADPGDLVAAGYRFDGWFDVASGGTAVTFPLTVTADTHLYAHWTSLFTVTYTTAQSVAPSSVVIPDGDTVADPGPLAATGWRFDGWYDAASGGAPVTFPFTVMEDTDIYAYWTEAPCDPATRSGDYCYTDDGSEATIVAYIGAGGAVTVPGTLGGFPVTTIGPSAFRFAPLWSVSLPDSVITIGDGAFYDSTVGYVAFGNSVVTIGAGAFQSAPLTEVTLPQTVQTIGTLAFNNASLTEVTIPRSVTSIDSMAFGGNELASVTMEGDAPADLGTFVFGPIFGTHDPLVTFHSGTAYAVDIPGYWNTLGAEYRVQEVSTVSFSSGYIGTLPYPVDLVTLNVLDGITESSLNDPGDPTAAGGSFDGWFAAPSGGERLTFPQTITTDTVLYAQWTPLPCDLDTRSGDYCYTEAGGNATITGYVGAGGAVTVPGTLDGFPVTAIGFIAFLSDGLTSVTLPGSVTDIGIAAFQSNALTSVVIPDSVTRIGDSAYLGNNISTLTLGSSLSTIDGYAFDDNSLTQVTIPASVQNLGVSAFRRNALAAVTMEGGEPATIGNGAFGEVGGANDPLVAFHDGATYTTATPGYWRAAATDYRVQEVATVTFDSAHGTAPFPSTVVTLNELEAITTGSLADPGTLAADGYRFDGWYTAPSGGTAIVFPMNTTADTAVYAHWTRMFDVNFATARSVAPAPVVVAAGGSLSDPGGLTATGYRFDGWFDAASGGSAMTFPFTVIADTDIYAHWTRMYDVTYTSDHAVAPSVATVATGTALAGPGSLHATGFHFDGWFDAASGGTEMSFPLTVTADTHLYAQWTPAFEVTYTTPEGTAPAPVEVAIGDTLTEPAPLAVDAHRFEGWYDAPTGGNPVEFPLVVTEDTQLYAQWVTREVTAPADADKGDTITITGTGFEPGESVDIELHSTPIHLITVIADGAGAIHVTVTIPKGADTGSHSLVLTGSVTGVSADPISINGSLAFTGTNPAPGILTALALIGLGLVLRRRASDM